VESTVAIAVALGVSENIIAFSLIAFGTSVPELSVAITASRKKEGDILIGNVLGSNIANILLVLGVSSMVRPIEVSSIATTFLDIPLMLAFALLMLLALGENASLRKREGVALVILYLCVLWRAVAIPFL